MKKLLYVYLGMICLVMNYLYTNELPITYYILALFSAYLIVNVKMSFEQWLFQTIKNMILFLFLVQHSVSSILFWLFMSSVMSMMKQVIQKNHALWASLDVNKIIGFVICLALVVFLPQFWTKVFPETWMAMSQWEMMKQIIVIFIPIFVVLPKLTYQQNVSLSFLVKTMHNNIK